MQRPVICLVVLAALAASSRPAAAQARGFLTGATLEQQLDSPLLATKPRASLRDVLAMISENRRIAILLDRRIDPDQIVPANINAPYFDEGVADLVRPLGAEVRVVADTVYIGPEQSIDTIRTRVAICQSAMDAACAGDAARKLILKRNAPVTWLELTSPRGIMTSLAARYKLTIDNPEAVPHDLWGPGTICSGDAAESLTLLAAQFNLDVHWSSSDSVRLFPAATNPVIEMPHRVRKADTLQPLLATLRAAHPEREFTVRGNSIVVAALVEEHDEIDLLLGNRQPRKAPVAATAIPLSTRRMSLEMQDQSLPSLIDNLRAQGMQVEYDGDGLRAAGIPLDKRLTVTLKDATIQQLLDKTALPLGLVYRIEGEKVILEAKPK